MVGGAVDRTLASKRYVKIPSNMLYFTQGHCEVGSDAVPCP